MAAKKRKPPLVDDRVWPQHEGSQATDIEIIPAPDDDAEQ